MVTRHVFNALSCPGSKTPGRAFSAKVISGKQTAEFLEFTFDVGAPALSGWLKANQMSVGACDDGHWYDLVFDCDVAVKRGLEGVFCELCPREARRIFATHEELWRDHLFKPLLRWVREKPAPATVLALFSTDPDLGRGATQAKLVRTLRDAAGATKLIVLAAP